MYLGEELRVVEVEILSAMNKEPVLLVLSRVVDKDAEDDKASKVMRYTVSLLNFFPSRTRK